MSVFLVVITFLLVCALVLVAAIRPRRSTLSTYELERRADEGDRLAKDDLRKQALRRDIESILSIEVAFLLVITSFLLVTTFGWLVGVIFIVVVLLVYGALARLRFVYRMTDRLYNRLEPRFFIIVEKMGRFMKVIRLDSESDGNIALGSRQELEHLVHHSEGVLSVDEKKLVVHGLSFSDRLVSDIMTPVEAIASVKKAEFLGPLTLDELHRSGHSHLPVVGKDINDVVGVLYLDTLLALDIKRSVTAEKAMDARIFYVKRDQTLPQLLAAFLRTHQHLFIVINKDKETVGLVTLTDVIEALIGQKIIDEFDDHESVHAVSQRSSHRKHDGI